MAEKNIKVLSTPEIMLPIHSRFWGKEEKVKKSNGIGQYEKKIEEKRHGVENLKGRWKSSLGWYRLIYWE